MASAAERALAKVQLEPGRNDDDDDGAQLTATESDSETESEVTSFEDDEEAAYDVDAIKWAEFKDSRRERINGFRGWHYGVMWNQYLKTLSDTIEPLESFEAEDGKTPLVDEFWKSVGRKPRMGGKEPGGKIGELLETPKEKLKEWFRTVRPRRDYETYKRRRAKELAGERITKADSDYYWRKKRKKRIAERRLAEDSAAANSRSSGLGALSGSGSISLPNRKSKPQSREPSSTSSPGPSSGPDLRPSSIAAPSLPRPPKTISTQPIPLQPIPSQPTQAITSPPKSISEPAAKRRRVAVSPTSPPSMVTSTPYKAKQQTLKTAATAKETAGIGMISAKKLPKSASSEARNPPLSPPLSSTVSTSPPSRPLLSTGSAKANGSHQHLPPTPVSTPAHSSSASHSLDQLTVLDQSTPLVLTASPSTLPASSVTDPLVLAAAARLPPSRPWTFGAPNSDLLGEVSNNEASPSESLFEESLVEATIQTASPTAKHREPLFDFGTPSTEVNEPVELMMSKVEPLSPPQHGTLIAPMVAAIPTTNISTTSNVAPVTTATTSIVATTTPILATFQTRGEVPDVPPISITVPTPEKASHRPVSAPNEAAQAGPSSSVRAQTGYASSVSTVAVNSAQSGQSVAKEVPPIQTTKAASSVTSLKQRPKYQQPSKIKIIDDVVPIMPRGRGRRLSLSKGTSVTTSKTTESSPVDDSAPGPSQSKPTPSPAWVSGPNQVPSSSGNMNKWRPIQSTPLPGVVAQSSLHKTSETTTRDDTNDARVYFSPLHAPPLHLSPLAPAHPPALYQHLPPQSTQLPPPPPPLPPNLPRRLSLPGPPGTISPGIQAGNRPPWGTSGGPRGNVSPQWSREAPPMPQRPAAYQAAKDPRLKGRAGQGGSDSKVQPTVAHVNTSLSLGGSSLTPFDLKLLAGVTIAPDGSYLLSHAPPITGLRLVFDEVDTHSLFMALAQGAEVIEWTKTSLNEDPKTIVKDDPKSGLKEESPQTKWEHRKSHMATARKMYVCYDEALRQPLITSHLLIVIVSTNDFDLSTIGWGGWDKEAVDVATLVLSVPFAPKPLPLLPNPIRPDFVTGPVEDDSAATKPSVVGQQRVAESYGFSEQYADSHRGSRVTIMPNRPPNDALYTNMVAECKRADIRPPMKDQPPDRIYILNAQLNRNLRSSTLRQNISRRPQIFALGPDLQLPASAWGMHEIWKTGGLVTFSPTFVLRSPDKFAEIVNIIRATPTWAAYVIPSTILWANESWKIPARCPDPSKAFSNLTSSLFIDDDLLRSSGSITTSAGGLAVTCAPPALHFREASARWLEWLRKVFACTDFDSLVEMCETIRTWETPNESPEVAPANGEAATKVPPAAATPLDLASIEQWGIQDLAAMRARPHTVPYRRYLYIGGLSLDPRLRGNFGDAIEFVNADDFVAVLSGAI